MRQAIKKTVFAKRMYQLLLDAGYLFDLRTEYLMAPLEDWEVCAPWLDVLKTLKVAIESGFMQNDSDGVDLLTEVTLALTPDVTVWFSDLLKALHGSGQVVMRRFTAATDDARYALAVCLLFWSEYQDTQSDVLSALGQITNGEVNTAAPGITMQHLIADAFFGPAWTSLYAPEHLSGEEICRYVIQARPPFFRPGIKTGPDRGNLPALPQFGFELDRP